MSSPRAPLRVAVVGARRVRQGTGPFLARFLHEAGAKVVLVVGTSEGSLATARDDLAAAGIAAAGRLVEDGLRPEDELDLVVIASPPATHAHWLDRAFSLRAHALCEKPLLEGPGAGTAAWDRARAFQRAGLHLVVAAQWPRTLPTFDALHPGVLARPPRRFSMHLAPTVSGPAMVPDSLPHPLSLLYAAVPDPEPRLEDVEVRPGDAEGRSATIRFTYGAAGHRVEVEVRLASSDRVPRPAGYAFDGRAVEREIEMAGYRLRLAADGRRLPLPDPLRDLAFDVVRRVSSADPPRVDPSACPGMRHVLEVLAAWPAGAPGDR